MKETVMLKRSLKNTVMLFGLGMVICLLVIVPRKDATRTERNQEIYDSFLTETKDKTYMRYSENKNEPKVKPDRQKKEYAEDPYESKHIDTSETNWYRHRLSLPKDITEIETIFSRPSVIKYNETSYWQVHISKFGSIQASPLGAYFDDRTTNKTIPGFLEARPAIGRFPKVRANVFLTNWTLFCQLWYNGQTFPHIVQGVVLARTKWLQNLHGATHVKAMITCQTRTSALPTHVSFTSHWREDSTIFLPVYVPKISNIVTFAHHVHPSWGYIYPPHLVEWFELYRLFGIEEFNFYNQSLPKELDKVFQYYINLGILNMVNITKAFVDHHSHFEAALLHTQYINMYRYKYLLVSDLDEIIVPIKHKSYSNMLQYVDSTINNYSQPFYCLTQKQFLRTLPKDETRSGLLRTMQYRKSGEVEALHKLPKSFTSLEHCVQLTNHQCWVFLHEDHNENQLIYHELNDNRWLLQSHFIEPDIALNFHYREKCRQHCVTFEESANFDDTMLEFEDDLIGRVKDVLNMIGFQE